MNVEVGYGDAAAGFERHPLNVEHRLTESRAAQMRVEPFGCHADSVTIARAVSDDVTVGPRPEGVQMPDHCHFVDAQQITELYHSRITDQIRPHLYPRHPWHPLGCRTAAPLAGAA